MRTQFRVAALASSLLALACACSKQAHTPAVVGSGSSDLAPDSVVATYSGKQVTAKQLDEHLGDQLQELDKQKYQMRRQGIEQMVVQELVKAEATKK